MKTEQEIRQMVNTCKQYHSCALCPYNPEDISRFIGDRWKGGCPNYDRQLVYAMGKGYGNISEYKSEIERLEQLNAIQCDAWQKLSDENERLVTENNSNLRYNAVLRKENKKLKEEIKQAQIDVLNELKERIKTAIDTYFNLDGGGYYLAEDAIDDIDELIKEIEK